MEGSAPVSEKVWIRRPSLVAGAAFLFVAAGVLLAGYAWTLFAWSGGEYADPPPSLGQKISQALPWALGTVVLMAILAIMGVWLVLISRRASPARWRPIDAAGLRGRPHEPSRGG
jgi:hypothetical protein